ncbi:MAG: SUMF1/EgtB/PvdO family nonheme iron enzyme [Nostoc sp. DedQUE08]|uniref:bifunctional serine/threonine-protein kinase/formylglycine-generating enzyme family protein n=1 Tax=unclassified Nostoc TaxID=2593658 RepID=UPI002AD41FEC|nr:MULTISPECIES: SUMF1/EgtB/PvdO family nonheme iron enzyme [unclassified Nostoc]MDZ8068400.1 SUMF1/EgtB/PvdO family nonheme iron enzyme [Nostoc sp. DedQUE08]MDZ8093154.1 SUMF1/EgtB/PvdO family nonheme iron enzyme [Nostoc sp. DedQUE05]
MNTLAGRYEIIRQIGSGGFGVTFLARDNLQPSKPFCVVKQLRSNQSNPHVIEFFEKEAAILERLGNHPQIPQSLAHFSENQNLYIVQEFIEGQDLSREIFPGEQLSEGDVTKLLQDVLEILSFVHSQGVIHRDIKPKNLMRRQQDGRIFLIDFGSVKELSSLMLNTEGEVKPSVVVVGTPGYMPNEQRNGRPCLASDVYALGITIIQALTGVLPSDLPEDPKTGEIIWRDQAQVSDHLAEVLIKMVRRHFSLRYAKAEEALQALTLPPTILVSPKQLYIQEARARVLPGQGNFSAFGLGILESLRIELGLFEDEAREIQEQVLKPYQEYQRKLEEYKRRFIDAVNQQYPFNPQTQKDLQDYQRRLELRDEDIAAVDALVPELLKQQKTSPKTVPSPGIQTQTFEFDTATLTLKSSGPFGMGKKTYEINRSRGSAEFFTEDLDNDVFIEMVAIPGGKFLMGSLDNEPERSTNESLQHTVTIQPFFMGKFPVTQAQWKAVAALGKVNIDLNPDPSNFKGANRPVEKVSWDEVIEFCDRLSKKTGKTYRLPSEAEWEYACRAGTTTSFYFGKTITTDLANYNGNYTYGSAPKGEYHQQTTTEVGKFPPNPFGLFDMCGNVWEWCRDQWHENYNNAPTDGSARLGDNRYRVWRGSSWEDEPRLCRSAARSYGTRGYRYPNAGFRVVIVRGMT